jgi:hypothetical protein
VERRWGGISIEEAMSRRDKKRGRTKFTGVTVTIILWGKAIDGS